MTKMKIENAEVCLQLIIKALSNVLSVKDKEFLEKAMHSYAAHVISEFLESDRRDLSHKQF